MQEIDELTGGGAEDPEESDPVQPFPLRRALYVVAALLVLVLLAVLPPLVNVSRFQHRIAASISESMGRPVRIDSVKLTLLPLPGFELENFVVAEDPAFGAEPVLRANKVRATLRVASLWRRKVEFSKISLLEPSVNLVHLPDGRWNLESILLQAARLDAAPTAQATASDAPRFPYIEATDARVNIKRGVEKLPFSLTEAKFALWLAQPDRWQLRLEAHPNRTDTNVTDTGTMRLNGTLGRAASLPSVPVDMDAEWTLAPLGAVSWIVLDEDAGLRGSMDLTASIHGTVGENRLTAQLKLKGARRAEFVPADPLDVDLGCQAHAIELFHALAELQCAWSPDSVHPGLTLTGAMPEVLHPEKSHATMEIAGVPAATLVDMLRVASVRTPQELTLEGTLSGKLTYPASTEKGADPTLLGELTIADALLRVRDDKPLVQGPVSARVQDTGLYFAPIPLELGGEQPATLAATLKPEGYIFHLAGTVLRSRLMALGAAIPQIGDGLSAAVPLPAPMETVPASEAKVDSKPVVEAPVTIDLMTTRVWGGDAPWTAAPAVKPVTKRKGKRNR